MRTTTLNGIDASRVRRINSAAVLDALRSGGRMGRREIAAITSLSFATVCRVVDDLMEQSLVCEVDSVSLGNARRRTALLDVNPDGGWVVAIDIRGSRIRAAAIDLAGTLHETIDIPLENIRGEESITPAVLAAVSGVLGRREPKFGKPRAIGASCSGVVDRQSGVVKLSFNLRLRDYPLARIIGANYDSRIVVCNDVAASTLAEARRGEGIEHPSFAFINADAGVGAGLVLDGRVQELSPHAEFGLMLVAPQGDPERFEGRGYLESLASGEGIMAAARRELESGTKSVLTKMAPAGPASVRISHIAQAARNNDELACRVLERAADYLGIGIVNLAHTLGLNLFVISGEVSTSGDAFWNPLRESVQKHEFWPGRIVLQPSRLQQDAALLGVGILALDEALSVG